jgi:nitrite reductase/ring-hydroxylating ferredoxin subunit/multimeric flavodoxin WrbA
VRYALPMSEWVDVGSVEALAREPLQEVRIGKTPIALSYVGGTFSAVSGVCNHVGGPLGEGRIDAAGYITCPWHGWKFHHATGEGEPGFEDDRVPRHAVKVEGGRVLVHGKPETTRNKRPHPVHPLQEVRARGEPGGADHDAPWRVLGVSTTNMDLGNPRFSTSDHLLDIALARARERGADTRLVRLAELRFRACEGYYSKSARACTWPCSITQMDSSDQLDQLYDGFVQWADVTIVATPIRWGAASSLYYKMAERLNCVQNQITLRNRVLMRNKVTAFIITGGQDNVQAVAGQMLNFFGELGCQFPQFPYIAHSRGWTAEDMEQNVVDVRNSADLREGARELVDRAIDTAEVLVGHRIGHDHMARGGRKAHALDSP